LLPYWRVIQHNNNRIHKPLLKCYSRGSAPTRTKKRKEKKRGSSNSFNSRGRGFVQGNSSESKHTNPSFGQHQGETSPKANKDEALMCQICNKRNCTTLQYFNQFNHSFAMENVLQALVSMTIADTQDGAWFLDTGATDHITSNLGNLHSLTPYHGHDGVIAGNKQILPITHIGQANIGSATSFVQLNDGLLVPQIFFDK
jgi:hypothetical protein